MDWAIAPVDVLAFEVKRDAIIVACGFGPLFVKVVRETKHGPGSAARGLNRRRGGRETPNPKP